MNQNERKYKKFQKLIGIQGLLYVALFMGFVAFLPVLPLIPDLESSAAEVSKYYSSYRVIFLLVNWLASIAIIPAMVFFTGLGLLFSEDLQIAEPNS